jgi:hypothetical protein
VNATLAALLFAHAVADFLLQSKTMVRRKKEPAMFLLHVAIVAGASWLALGLGRAALVPVELVATTHLAIDAVKTFRLPGNLASFVADQAAHLIIIAAVALAFPGTYAMGLWGTTTGPAAPLLAELPGAMVFAAGLIFATQAGSFAIGLLMAGLPPLNAPAESLPSGGRAIGLLERALIFLFVLTGQTAAIGFLIAAKSILRFGEVQDDRRAAEYVIIGTLASFAWALAAAQATLAALAGLPAP